MPANATFVIPPFRNNAIWHLKDSTCRYLCYAICRFTTIYSNDRQMAQQEKGDLKAPQCELWTVK